MLMLVKAHLAHLLIELKIAISTWNYLEVSLISKFLLILVIKNISLSKENLSTMKIFINLIRPIPFPEISTHYNGKNNIKFINVNLTNFSNLYRAKIHINKKPWPIKHWNTFCYPCENIILSQYDCIFKELCAIADNLRKNNKELCKQLCF